MNFLSLAYILAGKPPSTGNRKCGYRRAEFPIINEDFDAAFRLACVKILFFFQAHEKNFHDELSNSKVPYSFTSRNFILRNVTTVGLCVYMVHDSSTNFILYERQPADCSLVSFNICWRIYRQSHAIGNSVTWKAHVKFLRNWRLRRHKMAVSLVSTPMICFVPFKIKLACPHNFEDIKGLSISYSQH